mgnify:FL=1
MLNETFSVIFKHRVVVVANFAISSHDEGASPQKHDPKYGVTLLQPHPL